MVLIFYLGALSSLAAHLRQARTGKWSPSLWSHTSFNVNMKIRIASLWAHHLLMPQVLTGKVLMVANAKQSYDLTIECKIEVTGNSILCNYT